MNVGIDSYCYHRLFGEVYPGQDKPEKELSFDAFLKDIGKLDIKGISLESCFIPRFNKEYLLDVKQQLDDNDMDRVYAWGHPDGLEGGKNEAAFDEMLEHIEYASYIGANVMRVVGSSLQFRFEDHAPQLEKLSQMFTDAAKVAARYNIKLAVENHIDYNSDEILQLITNVNSPYFGVNFDTGNFLRVLDDPIQAMEKLAPYVLATHIKDLKPVKGVPVNEWYFFSCVPTGEGLVDNARLAQILKQHNYKGFLAVEIDFLHPDYTNQEEDVVKKSVAELWKIAGRLEYA
ncbi:sugar phosphate isomerase/epimerase family protein [Mucilaginibacter aquatilis]|uniref:TIM barrel protein n=1 Tax=Mucilaginibacter aquatilis TaxID=1517760 RepID=A0A6I4I969_9SPHI|nr:sugar phosphate isomerase/epimerase family protein [Mucilaginibacter aquatilis]MVN91805.1 TIM barrel protein [Mucilaginibacter aquatilis]